MLADIHQRRPPLRAPMRAIRAAIPRLVLSCWKVTVIGVAAAAADSMTCRLTLPSFATEAALLPPGIPAITTRNLTGTGEQPLGFASRALTKVER